MFSVRNVCQTDQVYQRRYHHIIMERNGKSKSGSAVALATGYSLDGPGIEFQWGRDFPHLSRSSQAHTDSCIMGTEYFLGVEGGRDWADPHPISC